MARRIGVHRFRVRVMNLLKKAFFCAQKSNYRWRQTKKTNKSFFQMGRKKMKHRAGPSQIYCDWSQCPKVPSIDLKGGDWKCSCGTWNFGTRIQCISCQNHVSKANRRVVAKNPFIEELRPGDWQCRICEALCYGNRADCYRCLAPRNKAPSLKAYPDTRMEPGDWRCPHCTFVNFSHRSRCYKCGRV